MAEQYKDHWLVKINEEEHLAREEILLLEDKNILQKDLEHEQKIKICVNHRFLLEQTETLKIHTWLFCLR